MIGRKNRLALAVLALMIAVPVMGAAPPSMTATWTRASDGPGYFWGQSAFAVSTGKPLSSKRQRPIRSKFSNEKPIGSMI